MTEGVGDQPDVPNNPGSLWQEVPVVLIILHQSVRQICVMGVDQQTAYQGVQAERRTEWRGCSIPQTLAQHSLDIGHRRTVTKVWQPRVSNHRIDFGLSLCENFGMPNHGKNKVCNGRTRLETTTSVEDGAQGKKRTTNRVDASDVHRICRPPEVKVFLFAHVFPVVEREGDERWGRRSVFLYHGKC